MKLKEPETPACKRFLRVPDNAGQVRSFFYPALLWPGPGKHSQARSGSVPGLSLAKRLFPIFVGHHPISPRVEMLPLLRRVIPLTGSRIEVALDYRRQ